MSRSMTDDSIFIVDIELIRTQMAQGRLQAGVLPATFAASLLLSSDSREG